MRRLLIVVFLLLSLGYVNYLAFATERQIDSGRTIFMELAPVDPRSLLQGDYMILGYAVDEAISDWTFATDEDQPNSGWLIVALDGDDVATFVAIDNEVDSSAESLPSNQLAIRYSGGDSWRINFAPRSFFFQEGDAPIYQEAEFAELRITDDGRAFLIGLRDSELGQLGLSE